MNTYRQFMRSTLVYSMLIGTSIGLLAQPDWPVTVTGDNHTIILEASITADIAGNSLAIGDYLGVFFEEGGVMKCAGKTPWTAENISISAYGDDNSTEEKEGFLSGEIFIWKVWRLATGEEFLANATYKPSDIIISHTDTYAKDGISSLASLRAEIGGLEPDWPVTQTGDNHTVIVEASIAIDITGSSLAVGDYIGVFFDDNGTIKCAGKTTWTGNNLSVAVYGDDNTTEEKEGLVAGELFSWKIWQIATEEEMEAVATYKPVGALISHTDAFAIDGISALASLTVEQGGFDWVVTPTSENHTLVIAGDIQSKLGDSPLAAGDYVGVFYSDLEGIQVCSGFGIWEGNDLVFPAYGNDAGPFGKNGFNSGDIFVWKVWKASENKTYEVAAVTYLPIGGLYTDQQFYEHNGLSGLASIFSDIEEHVIDLQEGWNLISSYIDPIEGDLSRIFSAIEAEVALVKDGSGAAYIPSFGLNQIGNWDVTKGYAVRVSQATSLSVYGTIVDPTTPLDLAAGWSLFPYLRQSSQPIALALNSILPDIIEVKDENGSSFIPSFGIDNIGTMRAGEAYKIRLVRDVTINYTARLAAPPNDWHTSKLKPTHFPLKKIALNNSATLVISQEVADKLASTGDEFGVYNTDRLLVGSAVYEGHNLAISLRGGTFEGQKFDAMREGEKFVLKYWNRQNQEEQLVRLALADNELIYQADKLFIARRLAPTKYAGLDLLENPIRDKARFQLDLTKSTDVQIAIYDLAGRHIKTLVNQKLEAGRHQFEWKAPFAKGLYFYKGTIGQITASGKIVVQN